MHYQAACNLGPERGFHKLEERKNSITIIDGTMLNVQITPAKSNMTFAEWQASPEYVKTRVPAPIAVPYSTFLIQSKEVPPQFSPVVYALSPSMKDHRPSVPRFAFSPETNVIITDTPRTPIQKQEYINTDTVAEKDIIPSPKRYNEMDIIPSPSPRKPIKGPSEPWALINTSRRKSTNLQTEYYKHKLVTDVGIHVKDGMVLEYR